MFNKSAGSPFDGFLESAAFALPATDLMQTSTIWGRNGGLYLGQMVEAPANPDKPLEGDGPETKVWKTRRDLKEYRFPAEPDNPAKQGDTHVFTCGPNGSGKTFRALIPNAYRLVDWSTVWIDPKGEIAANTAIHRAKLGPNGKPTRPVKVIDPFGVMAANYPRLVAKHPDIFKSAGCNPLASLQPDKTKPGGRDFVDAAKVLAQAIIKIDDKGEKHWAESAQALVAGLIMAACLEFPGEASLKQVRAWLGMEPDALGVRLKSRLKKDDPKYEPGLIDSFGREHPALAAKLNRFAKANADNKELAGILSTALTQTDWLDSDAIQEDLAQGNYDFASLKATPTTVYLILPPDYLASHATWLRVVISTILRPLLRSVTDSRVPVLFALDEFAQLGHMEIIVSNLAIMRGFGVKLWAIFQDLAQAKTIYSERWESFISNSGVVQTFAMQDMTSREYFEKMSGTKMWWYETSSGGTSHNTAAGSSSQGMSQNINQTGMMVPRLYGQDIASMEPGQTLLFARGGFRRSYLPWPNDIPEFKALLDKAKRDTTG